MKVFVNLVAVKEGGQIVRAKNFISEIGKHYPNIVLYVVKLDMILNDLESFKNVTVVNITLGNRFFLIKRFWWENFIMQDYISSSKANVFLSFSHYLPIRSIKVPTLVGISNLAPFMSFTYKEESLFYILKFKLLKLSILNSLKKADLIIALSLTAKSKLLEFNFLNEKIVLCPIGIESQWGSSQSNILSRSLIKTTNKRYMLYVSHFYGYKNHKRLIRAYEELPGKVKENLNLVLIGRPNNRSYFKSVIGLISEKELNSNIFVIEGLDREQLQVYYKNCCMFIFPSLVENCPNSLLEAMSCGCPVATSYLEPMREYCQEAAIYFDPYDYRSIKKAMLNTMDDKLLKNLSILSVSRSKSFTWKEFTSILVDSFNVVIK